MENAYYSHQFDSMLESSPVSNALAPKCISTGGGSRVRKTWDLRRKDIPNHDRRTMATIRLFLCGLIASLFALYGSAAAAQLKAELKPRTLKAFEEYSGGFEKNIDAMVSGEKPFLWIHTQNPDLQSRARRGEIVIFKSGDNVDIPDGIIHVWGVSSFVAGTQAEDVVGFLLDYDRHKEFYPSVINSKILGKNGDTVKGFLKFKYKKALTAILNTEHQAELTRLSRGRYFVRVCSTRIAEVDDFGKPTERELPVGRDRGFMWRLNSYWFVEPQKGGVFLECQSLTLTRSIPFGLRWIIKPFVESIPRDSLKEVVEGARTALQK
jgi:hypothetical protein